MQYLHVSVLFTPRLRNMLLSRGEYLKNEIHLPLARLTSGSKKIDK